MMNGYSLSGANGWRCPVCNRGVAPTERQCDHGGAASLSPYYGPPGYYPNYMYGGGAASPGAAGHPFTVGLSQGGIG